MSKDDSDSSDDILQEWIPENEFTFKSDVVDSGHVNNVVIGKVVNECNLFDATPPMTANLWTNGDPKKIAQRIKYTSDGFPCLLFIKFASGAMKFLGIYNFNLGRNAYYNLGLKILKDYEIPENRADNAPFVLDSMTSDNDLPYSEFTSTELNTYFH
jgi:hypothetical protein